MKTKKKSFRKLEFYPIYTLSSNDLQALSWAFALGRIGLKEALVDCSWSLEKNQSELIEPVLRLAKVGPKVWAKVRAHFAGMNVGANVRGLTLTLMLAMPCVLVAPTLATKLGG